MTSDCMVKAFFVLRSVRTREIRKGTGGTWASWWRGYVGKRMVCEDDSGSARG